MGEINLQERLTLIFEWYKALVSEKTRRLPYIYYPGTDAFIVDGSPCGTSRRPGTGKY